MVKKKKTKSLIELIIGYNGYYDDTYFYFFFTLLNAKQWGTYDTISFIHAISDFYFYMRFEIMRHYDDGVNNLKEWTFE